MSQLFIHAMLGGMIWKICVHTCLPVSNTLHDFILFVHHVDHK